MINKFFSTIFKPGCYGDPNQGNRMFGIPVAEKDSLSYADAFRLDRFLMVLRNLDLVWAVTKGVDVRKNNDNELYYKITIWEDLNVD